MGCAGSLKHSKSIEDMIDFRKSHGVSDDVLRSFIVTEVYLRRGKRCLATVEAIESVIPFHLQKIQGIIQKCKSPSHHDATVTDLTYATRFITAFLFLSVKCSRDISEINCSYDGKSTQGWWMRRPKGV